MSFGEVAEDVFEGAAAVATGAAAVAALPVELPIAATVGLTALASYGAYKAEKGAIGTEQSIQNTGQITQQRLNLQEKQYDLSLEEDAMRHNENIKRDSAIQNLTNLKRNMSAAMAQPLRPQAGPDNTSLHQPASSKNVVVYTRTRNQGPGPVHITYGSPSSFIQERNQQHLVNLRSQAENAISMIRNDWGFQNATSVNHISIGGEISKTIAQEMANRYKGKYY